MTAAHWNQDVVANTQASVPDVFTTAGDIAYATAADTVARLGIGVKGKLLVVNSAATAPEWQDGSAIANAVDDSVSWIATNNWDDALTVSITPKTDSGNFIVLGGAQIQSDDRTSLRCGIDSSYGHQSTAVGATAGIRNITAMVIVANSTTAAHTAALQMYTEETAGVILVDAWLYAFWIH